MKKCPDCGMTIANQAIRCPKCKFNFAEAPDAGGAAVQPEAAAVSAAATGTPVSSGVVGIMPMVDVNKSNVDEFYGQLKNAIVKRKQEFDKFIDFLENRTAWLTAPADTEGPLACEKGLLIRSVAVTKQLLRIKDTLMPQLDEESAIIIGLFHEVGKAGVEGKPYFLVEERLGSTSSTLGLSFSSRISTPSASTSNNYSINHKIVNMSVGVRSLYLVSQYMLISDDEAQAISYGSDPTALKDASPYTLVLQTAIRMQKDIYENSDVVSSYSFTVKK